MRASFIRRGSLCESGCLLFTLAKKNDVLGSERKIVLFASSDKPIFHKNVALFVVKAGRCREKYVNSFSVNQYGDLKT